MLGQPLISNFPFSLHHHLRGNANKSHSLYSVCANTWSAIINKFWVQFSLLSRVWSMTRVTKVPIIPATGPLLLVCANAVRNMSVALNTYSYIELLEKIRRLKCKCDNTQTKISGATHCDQKKSSSCRVKWQSCLNRQTLQDLAIEGW